MSGIRSSAYFNNPAFAQAASNLTQLFAPPSGSDAAGWAAANAKKAEADRLAQFFTNAPSMTRDDYDRTGAALGIFDPTQGFGARDMADATTRYGYDTAATTSRMNNAADNQRSLLSDLYRPLDPGQVRPELPGSIAGAYGMPGVTVPGVAGAPKPLTDAEVKGGVLSGMSPELQQAITFGSTPVETIVTPEGPRLQTRTGALGQEPFINKGAEAKPDVENYRTLDGREGTAVYDPELGWKDTQTGEKLPQGTRTFKSQAQGTVDDATGTKTNITRAQQIVATVDNTANLVAELETLVRNNPAATGLAGDIRSFGQDIQQVVAEFSQSFGDDPNAIISTGDMQAIANRLLPNTTGYNPVYRQTRALLLELAYANAKMNNPTGEVSRFALEREMENLGQGLVGNDQGVLAVTDIAKGRMQRVLREAEILRGNAPAPTTDDPRLKRDVAPAPAAPGGVEKWGRDANGRPVRIQ